MHSKLGKEKVDDASATIAQWKVVVDKRSKVQISLAPVYHILFKTKLRER